MVVVAVLLELAGSTVRPPRQRGCAQRTRSSALADGAEVRGRSPAISPRRSGSFLRRVHSSRSIVGVTLGVLLGSSRTLRSRAHSRDRVPATDPRHRSHSDRDAVIRPGRADDPVRDRVCRCLADPHQHALRRPRLSIARCSTSRGHPMSRESEPLDARDASRSACRASPPGFSVGASIALVVCVTAEYVAGTGRGRRVHARPGGGVRAVGDVRAPWSPPVCWATRSTSPLRIAQRRVVFWAGEERVVL